MTDELRNKLQARQDMAERNQLYERNTFVSERNYRAKTQKNLSICHGTSRGQLLSQEIQSFPSAENHAKTFQFTESEKEE